jgi:hypothetical protein
MKKLIFLCGIVLVACKVNGEKRTSNHQSEKIRKIRAETAADDVLYPVSTEFRNLQDNLAQISSARLGEWLECQCSALGLKQLDTNQNNPRNSILLCLLKHWNVLGPRIALLTGIEDATTYEGNMGGAAGAFDE